MTNEKRAPFVHHMARPVSLSLDAFIALVPLFLFSTVFFGSRPLLLAFLNMATAVLCEAFACLLLKRKPQIKDGTSLITALLITGMLSPTAPFWLGMVATAFAVLLVKMAFGGTGRNLFNPAAAGIAFITQCFPGLIFQYPESGFEVTNALLFQNVSVSPSPASSLQTGGTSSYLWYEFLLGQVPGSIATTAILVLCASMIFLFVRKSASPATTLSFLATCALIAIAFPRVEGTWYNSVLLELCSGYLIFGAIFLLNDPVTTPNHWLARLFFGIFAGILVMVFRHIGRFEEGLCFAVLLMNTLSTILDRQCWKLLHNPKRRKEEMA